jgi:hypothetical protein
LSRGFALLLTALVLAALLLALLSGRATNTYSALVAKAKAGEPVDFTALRMAYAAIPDHEASEEALDKKLEKMGSALDYPGHFQDKPACRKAIEETDKLLDAHYVSVQLHGLRMMCFQTLGDQAQAKREDRFVMGLYQSILAKGDGSSPEKAIFVVSPSEEEFVLGLNGFEEDVSRETMERDGHHFDVLDQNSKLEGEKKFYFRTD